jgi:CHAD domain-containing protein
MAVSTHLETERKYETGVDTELPALPDIPGVAKVDGPRTEQLEAIYFDTADLRLARHGATLRRRTGGTDAGWHLKVPAGPDSRSELRLPLSASATNAPPDELADLTFGMARGAEIRPVARIRTTRDVWQLFGAKGEPLAEVTDDRVEARRLGDSSTVDTWRELEVELSDPDHADVLDRTEKVLRKAGIRRAKHSSKLARVLPAPPAPETGGDTAGDAVLAYIRTQFEAIVTQDLRVRQDAEDAVHQMRVAARRLRSVLRVYDTIVDGARTRGLRARLQWLGRRLAQARDLEVQHEHFRSAVASLPTELVVGPVEARLTRHFGPAEAQAHRAVVKALRDKRYRRVLDELDRLLTEPPLTSRAARPARKELPKHLRRARRKVVARVVPESLHRGRKAAKRYRYGLEVAEPALGKKARRKRKRAKALTRVLGRHQDGFVAQPVLRDLGMRAHLAGENGFTFGLLVGRERERCAQSEREYRAYL